MGIRTRFIYVFFGILFVAGLGLSYVVFNLSSVRSNLTEIYELRLKSTRLLLEADRDAYQLSIALSEILHQRMVSLKSHEELKGEMDQNGKQVRERFDKFLELWNQKENDYGKDGTEWIQLFNTHYPEWMDRSSQILAMVEGGDFAAARVSFSEEYADSFDPMRKAIDKLTELSLDKAEVSYNHSMDGINFQITISILTALSILVISLVLSIFLTRSITAPIYESVQHADRMAGGALKLEFDTGRKDEFGLLYRSFDNLVSRVGSVIMEVQGTSARLAAASEEMTAATMSFSDIARSQATVTQEVTATVEQISAGQDGVAASALDQVDSMNHLMGMMENLSASIKEMNGHLSANMALAQETVEVARVGNHTLNEMTDSMQKINQSSGEVTEIVAIISGISEQVNLLSLNAAIEAARAGESGRGFAVVADEISRLADKTATSIKNIDSLINANTEEIHKGLSSVEKTVGVVSQIIEKIEAIGHKMNEMNQSMTKQLQSNDQVNQEAMRVKGSAENINDATGEQKIAVADIVNSINSLSTTTTTLASGAQEMAASAQEVATNAENLNQKIEFFKL